MVTGGDGDPDVSRLMPVLAGLLLLFLPLGMAVAGESDGLLTPPADTAQEVPATFPRFVLEDHARAAQVLNRFTWHHYSRRGRALQAAFEQEWMTLADMWLGGATVGSGGKSIQRDHREKLLNMRMDPDGYVHTHQHFSCAHEGGWPFPVWPQTPGGRQGLTAGWHFQDEPSGYGARLVPRDSRWTGEGATEGWELHNLRSTGLRDKMWRLEATGQNPALTTPGGVTIDAFCAPFLQLRWTRSGQPPADTLPYVEWKRDQDDGFSPERRVHFGFDSGNPDYERRTGVTHSMITMHTHPRWEGKIDRVRIVLAPGEENVNVGIHSFFTVFDTRHPVNNSLFILACWNYFRWSGDVPFLRREMNRMRRALGYMRQTLGGLEYNCIRTPWVGHSGLSGFDRGPDGSKEFHPGRGIGSNYWDILPFGNFDMYATNQYHRATRVMARLEQAVREHPGWDVPLGAAAYDPQKLRDHASEVQKTANEKFWNDETGRFVACIDTRGNARDYGFTFVNLDSIWYGTASPQHRRDIMDWLTGERIVEGDTSTGRDIYHWRFGPRSTTRRNIDWYAFPWTSPEDIPWGLQVQDGGAVLGFSFFDLWARLHVLGADNAWDRLQQIVEWQDEVWQAGGCREYYRDHEGTLQGGGTPGGLGIDNEFFESSLLPCIVTYGFLGLDPRADHLRMAPRLPDDCPRMGVTNLWYRGVRMDVEATDDTVRIALRQQPADALRLRLEGGWTREGSDRTASFFELKERKTYTFAR